MAKHREAIHRVDHRDDNILHGAKGLTKAHKEYMLMMAVHHQTCKQEVSVFL